MLVVPVIVSLSPTSKWNWFVCVCASCDPFFDGAWWSYIKLYKTPEVKWLSPKEKQDMPANKFFRVGHIAIGFDPSSTLRISTLQKTLTWWCQSLGSFKLRGRVEESAPRAPALNPQVNPTSVQVTRFLYLRKLWELTIPIDNQHHQHRSVIGSHCEGSGKWPA